MSAFANFQSAAACLPSTLPFWDELSDADKNFVTRVAELRIYNARESIHDAATDCRGLLLVVDGYIRSYISSESGKEVTLFITPAGKSCISPAYSGINGVFQNIQAVKSCSLIYINEISWNELVSRCLPAARHALGAMACHAESILQALELQLFSSVEKRIASLLLHHSELWGTESLALTHSEIALHLGTAREVVSRSLKTMRESEILETRRNAIIILDSAALRSIQF